MGVGHVGPDVRLKLLEVQAEVIRGNEGFAGRQALQAPQAEQFACSGRGRPDRLENLRPTATFGSRHDTANGVQLRRLVHLSIHG